MQFDVCWGERMTPCPKCGWKHSASIAISIECVMCGTVVDIEGGSAALTKTRRLPFVQQPSADTLKQQGRDCWIALHTMTEPTAEKVQEWITTIPVINCGCRKFARDYIEDNPPPCDNLPVFRRWTYDFHCVVDKKTGDAAMSWQDACQQWGWVDGAKPQ
jgi:hypothetical protein